MQYRELHEHSGKINAWFQLNVDMHRTTGCVMITSSNGNIFRVTGHLCGTFAGHGEFPAQRPVTWSFDVFCDHLRPNKRMNKQRWGWWLETPWCPLWRHNNVKHVYNKEYGSWVDTGHPKKCIWFALCSFFVLVYKPIKAEAKLTSKCMNFA